MHRREFVLAGATVAAVGLTWPAEAAAAVKRVVVRHDGRVATDQAYDGPQVTSVRVLQEGRFLEIYWDRYVDEEAAVSGANITLLNGSRQVTLIPKPATGSTESIFFDKDNKQIAATPAKSMSRLPEDLHLASIGYQGNLDTSQPITVRITGARIKDAAGRSAVNATYSQVPRLSFYPQSVTTSAGVRVKGTSRVDPATLTKAAAQVEVQLAKTDNGIAARMRSYGASLAVYGARENAYLVPEHRGAYNPATYDVEGFGGTTYNNGVSSISERNVLRTRGNSNAFLNTSYPNENILIHEFGHAVLLIGIVLLPDQSLNNEVTATYQDARNSGRWPNTYAISNRDEFFATLSSVWFNVMAEKPNFNDGVRGPVNTREEMRTYDPRAYALFSRIYPADRTLPAPWDVPSPDIYHP